MAWVKIPAENHPLFLAAVPKDRRVSTLKMFGGVAGLVNGNMFGGLFARSIVVKLSETDQREAMKLDGTAPFDPMGNGRVMKDTLLLPESVMDEPAELAGWLCRALEYTATLPAKKKTATAAKKSTKPAAKAAKAKASKASKATKPAAKAKASKAKPAAKAKASKAKKRT
jgi:TfoX/Sxy family transcriptional regulator of competence genes